MSAPIQGPWLVNDRTVYKLTADGDRNAFWAGVQSCQRPDVGEATAEECAAIAHLIAAAPDLLAVLVDLTEGGNSRGCIEGENDWWTRVHAAIAKARGSR